MLRAHGFQFGVLLHHSHVHCHVWRWLLQRRSCQTHLVFCDICEPFRMLLVSVVAVVGGMFSYILLFVRVPTTNDAVRVACLSFVVVCVAFSFAFHILNLCCLQCSFVKACCLHSLFAFCVVRKLFITFVVSSAFGQHVFVRIARRLCLALGASHGICDCCQLQCQFVCICSYVVSIHLTFDQVGAHFTFSFATTCGICMLTSVHTFWNNSIDGGIVGSLVAMGVLLSTPQRSSR